MPQYRDPMHIIALPCNRSRAVLSQSLNVRTKRVGCSATSSAGCFGSSGPPSSPCWLGSLATGSPTPSSPRSRTCFSWRFTGTCCTRPTCDGRSRKTFLLPGCPRNPHDSWWRRRKYPAARRSSAASRKSTARTSPRTLAESLSWSRTRSRRRRRLAFSVSSPPRRWSSSSLCFASLGRGVSTLSCHLDRRIYVGIFFRTVNDFFYIGGQLNVENLAGNQFVNFAVVAFTEMPSVFIGESMLVHVLTFVPQLT